MIIPGICSITLKHLSPDEVIGFMVANQLQAIEWWAGGHVLPGDIAGASEVGRLTRLAGLRTSSYGSYYRVGVSENDGMPFAGVLESAVALGAPTIRVWAGTKNAEDADVKWVAKVVADTNRIADLAAKRGVSITFEFHGGMLTNTNANALRFAAQVPHPNVFFSWQAPHGFPVEHALAGLESLLPRLSTVHVYHWTIGSYEKSLFNDSERTPAWPGDYHRHSLVDGHERWQAYLARVRTTGRDHCALLEFVRGDTVEQAQTDGAELKSLCYTNR